ncbi:MAG: alpha/beta hydrolase [Alphaproteobacteria bacterium]|nr:alpha/beta hydrolase [Alphaproteobacteria bacterium]
MTDRRQLLLGAGALSFAGACAPLTAFDTLIPKDAGTRRVASAAYAAGPRGGLDIYAPTGARTAPVVLFFYGGSWNSGRRQDYAFAGRALAALGYVVAIPDYRLVPEVRFPAFVEDGAAALAWATQNIAASGGDPGRIVLCGHSAGAYIALMLALDARYGEAAGAPRGAVRGAVGLAGPYDFYPFDVDSTRAAFGAAPDPAATQPISFAHAGAPPTLLLTGLDDTTVRPRNTRALAAKLAQAGADVTTREYPDVDHGDILLALARPLRGRAPVLADIRAFVERVAAPR